MKKKILLIDDTYHLLEEISDILVMEGYEVVTANDSFDGFNKIAISKPDLIITDLIMPEVDGYGLIEKLKSLNKYKDIPIVVLSAMASKENIEKAFELEANYYLKKPCSADELITVVQNLLDQENYGN